MRSYFNKIKPFVVRNAIIAIIGLGILVVIDFIVEGSFFSALREHSATYLLIVGGYIIASEGTLFIDKWLSQKYGSKIRMQHINLLKIICILIFYFLLYQVFYYIITPEPFTRKTIITILISIIYVVLIDLILIISRYKDRLQMEQEAHARLKEEKLVSDLQALQNQLNPHFLFNSLNVLVSEIYDDADRAVNYISQLSDILRYVLQSSDSFTVTLQKELEFLNSYVYLYKVRYGDALIVEIDDVLNELQAEIPPLVLQILLENCIKHNKIQLNCPLKIDIEYQDGTILVTNNLIKKQDTFSTTTGLANIRKRYALLKKMDIIVKETKTHFQVQVPLIEENIPEA